MSCRERLRPVCVVVVLKKICILSGSIKTFTFFSAFVINFFNMQVKHINIYYDTFLSRWEKEKVRKKGKMGKDDDDYVDIKESRKRKAVLS